MKLELSAAFGLVTGYQSYPLPLTGVQARLDLYHKGKMDIGIEMAAMPYIAKDSVIHKNKFGVVGTTPFLSLRYPF